MRKRIITSSLIVPQSTTEQTVLNVFEAFSGIGAQNSALKSLGVPYRVVGTSDWFVNAIIAYDVLHSNQVEEIAVPPYEEQLKYLKQFTFSAESQKAIKNLEGLGRETIKRLYIAQKRTHNYGSITDIKPEELPDIDLLIYSFPCQDLSTGGNGNGMGKDSGTRSSTIWHIGKILRTLKRLGKLPEYLLMENVPAIQSDRYKADFNKWKVLLSGLGYKNDRPVVLDASKFGIPQDRVRLFMASHLKTRLNIGRRIQQHDWDGNIADFLRLNYADPRIKAEADEASLNLTPSRQVMWDINKREPPYTELIHTITCNMDRTQTAALFRYEKRIRRLTIREAYLLMGFTEADYEKVAKLGFSYRQNNKLIGNAIVVPVLREVFRAMLQGSKYMPDTVIQEGGRKP
jgi:Site-specific DNA methylase